jgi:ubiquinone/menaquinone biosynthesis C-methylase UbiE
MSQKTIQHYQQTPTVESYNEKRFSTRGGRLVGVKEKSIVQKLVGTTVEDWVLDMGTGTGRVATWFKNAKKVGVDSSIAMLKKAKKLGLHVICCDIKQLPIKDATFSRVVAIRVFIRIDDLSTLLKDVSRVSQEGGWFVFDVSNKFSIGVIANRFSHEPPHTFFSKKEIEKALHQVFSGSAQIEPSFMIPRGVYQKINRSIILWIWQIDNLLLKTRLRQFACTHFWKAHNRHQREGGK